MSILIGIVTFILILVSGFLILVVLAQKAKSDGGVGAAMGGGMAEATFGAETGNVLTAATRNATIAFFVLSFGLYLAHLYQYKHAGVTEGALPAIPVSSTPAPAPVLPTAPEATTTPPSAAATAPATAAPAAGSTLTPPAPAPAEEKKP
jgi:preprotein translocase subunit SecG